MQLFRPPNVEKLRTKGDIRGLIKALSYKREASVRAKAATALGVLKDPRAIEPLIAALNDCYENVRGHLAMALVEVVEIGGTLTIELIITVLKNTLHNLRFGSPESDAYDGAIDALKK